ncbi:MAG TPA: sialidase family protein [Candidatus Thermoplasmatota archaeon]|nr:sialidase family protein [Candidatus Thermoplasmatota archaeon]
MRPVRLVLVILGATLAGCSTDPGPDPHAGPASPDLGQAVAFHVDGTPASNEDLAGAMPMRGAQRSIGANSFEPTLGVDPSGAIYMAARFESTAGERIRASFDQGTTWKEVGPYVVPGLVTNPVASGDPFIYVDPATGRVFGAHLTSFACTWIVFSDDQGASWETNPAACGLPPGGDDHQSIVGAPARTSTSTYGENRLVHYCAQNNLFNHCAMSADGGRSFGVRSQIVFQVGEELPGGCTAASGHVRADHAGRVFLGKVHCGTPVLMASEDEGRTWTQHIISETSDGDHYHLELAADAADNLYALWTAADLPRLAVSRDHGVTWSEPMVVSPPAVTTTSFPVLDAGGEARVVVGYYGSTRTEGATAPWHAYIGVLSDALAPDPVVYTVTADSEEDPLARECSGRCGGAGDFLDIAIGPDGRPWMALTDVCHSACVAGTANDAGANHAGVGTLAEGPSLLDGRPLPPLTPV